ncbi:MAG: hypothetical protein J7K33_05180 [Candidatus Marinimicrobia bacterium]|nr:hypothetical protein [Candidatus Neomarinimicrobiota bacterium]
MRKSILFLIIFLAILSSCERNDAHNNSKAKTYSIVHDGIMREYALYVPNSYTGTFAVPLVINFHGFGGNVREYMNYADMRPVAEADTFILVYPQGSYLDGSSHWNPCPPGGDNKSSADDFGFIEDMIKEISTHYNIDMKRIYAVGYSNGGMMAYGLANYKSELIAAVASVSGTMLDCIGPTSHPMPVLDLHGTSDDVIPYNGNSYYNSVQSVLGYWIDFNNTNKIPIVSVDSSGGMTIEHYVYDQGDNGVSVEHYKYIGGKHVWFTTPYRGKTTSELIWDFLSRYDINGLR